MISAISSLHEMFRLALNFKKTAWICNLRCEWRHTIQEWRTRTPKFYSLSPLLILCLDPPSPAQHLPISCHSCLPSPYSVVSPALSPWCWAHSAASGCLLLPFCTRKWRTSAFISFRRGTVRITVIYFQRLLNKPSSSSPLIQILHF